MITTINSLSNFKTYVEIGEFVIIDFFATWCGPCIKIKPEFERLSQKYPNCTFYQVDVDDSPDISTYCNINCMPTFQYYHKGLLVDESSGADINIVTQKIDNIINSM